jgi:oligopeptide/dipeptide ABC transporter ATP-binding protein
VNEKLLEVHQLTTVLPSGAPVVDRASFSIAPGRSLGLTGESGCGKSTTALALMRLLPAGTRTVAGAVRLEGQELLALPERQMRAVRGAQLAISFQDAASALHPMLTVGAQIEERSARPAVELLDELGMPAPAEAARAYPHQLSGGMQQRALLAIALAQNPKLLIADEPTSSLDATLQAQVLERLRQRQRARGLSLLLISHDPTTLQRVCDEAAVMYAGRVVERAPVQQLLERPAHPYTAGLLASIPRPEQHRQPLPALVGGPPAPGAKPSGCAFRTRCPRASERCVSNDPELTASTPEREVACHHPMVVP